MIVIKSSRNILISIVLLTSIIFTTMVYSAFSTKLQIGGELIVRSDDDIRVTNISIKETTNGAYETYNNKYTKDTTSMFVTLPSNSSITYEVTITNKDSYGYIVEKIETLSNTNTNSNIDIDIELKENDLIDSNSIKTFTVSFTNNTDTEQISTLVLKYSFLKNSFIVTFDTNGGSIDTQTKEVAYGSLYGELPIPTKEGYTFKGWNGKNLFNIDNLPQNNLGTNYNGGDWYGRNYASIENGIIKVIMGANQNRIYLSGSEIYLKNNTEITISVDTMMVTSINNLGEVIRIVEKGLNDSMQENIIYLESTNEYYRIHGNFTIQDDGYYLLGLLPLRGMVDQGTDSRFKNIQIELGNVATEYEPYYVTSNVKVTQMKDHTLKAIWEEN